MPHYVMWMRHCGPILIVDDDAAMRELVACLLKDAGYETFDAPTGESALAFALERRPALVLLDVHLAGLSGYEVCQQLRERYGQQLPIIFLSGERTEAHDRVAGLLIGGDDYLTKPFSPDELVARVRRQLVRASAAVGGEDALAEGAALTRREQEVLRLMAEGLSQIAIASQLYISPNTVATHIQRILSKLDVHSRAGAVARAYRLGLVITQAETPAV
jgi:DNA-binding NarL/FixJ family response regulator